MSIIIGKVSRVIMPYLHVGDGRRAATDEVVPTGPIVVPALDNQWPKEIAVGELLDCAL